MHSKIQLKLIWVFSSRWTYSKMIVFLVQNSPFLLYPSTTAQQGNTWKRGEFRHKKGLFKKMLIWFDQFRQTFFCFPSHYEEIISPLLWKKITIEYMGVTVVFRQTWKTVNLRLINFQQLKFENEMIYGPTPGYHFAT